jgi:hypothetical protein
MVRVPGFHPIVVLGSVAYLVCLALLATLGFFPCLCRVADPVHFLCRMKGLVSLELSGFFEKFHVVVVLVEFDADVVLGTGEGDFWFVELSAKFVYLVVEIC